MLPAYGGEAALRGAFFTSLKEAAVVCRGSAQRVMEMAAGAQASLSCLLWVHGAGWLVGLHARLHLQVYKPRILAPLKRPI